MINKDGLIRQYDCIDDKLFQNLNLSQWLLYLKKNVMINKNAYIELNAHVESSNMIICDDIDINQNHSNDIDTFDDIDTSDDIDTFDDIDMKLCHKNNDTNNIMVPQLELLDQYTFGSKNKKRVVNKKNNNINKYYKSNQPPCKRRKFTKNKTSRRYKWINFVKSIDEFKTFAKNKSFAEKNKYLKSYTWDQLYDICSHFGLSSKFSKTYTKNKANMTSEIAKCV
eukprot:63592_1